CCGIAGRSRKQKPTLSMIKELRFTRGTPRYRADRSFQAASLAGTVLRFATERRSARKIAWRGSQRSRTRRASALSLLAREIPSARNFPSIWELTNDRITLRQA